MAAAAILVTALATKQAHAFARPPRDRRPHHCFLGGTRIRTPEGDVAVEDLAVGDLVTTLDGSAQPITWIDSKRFDREPGTRWPADLAPVKVSRSALGTLVPHVDLYLSPMHCVYVDGLLVPARSLINGRTIVQCGSFEADTIEYFHVELAKHNVIFAHGAPAETDITPELGVGELEFYTERASPSRKEAIRSRLRSAVSPWIDRRQRVDVIWERIAERAET